MATFHREFIIGISLVVDVRIRRLQPPNSGALVYPWNAKVADLTNATPQGSVAA
jgi:hypothetical protein